MPASWAAIALPASAAEGEPRDWQLGFQPAATPVAEQMHGFHNLLLVICTLIVLLVLGLLVWVMIRYNEKANPVPSRTSHNTAVEVLWTIVPVLILLIIAIPSFRLLYAQYDVPKPDLTVKVTGEFCRSRRTCTRPSLGVNLMAFESRFQTTCCKRS